MLIALLGLVGCDSHKVKEAEALLKQSEQSSKKRTDDAEVAKVKIQNLEKHAVTQELAIQHENNHVDDLQIDLTKKQQLDRDFENLQETLKSLKATKEKLEELHKRRANVTFTPTSPSPEPRFVEPTKPTPPRWVEPTQYAAEREIKETAQAKWGTDFKMTAYEIDKQNLAFIELRDTNRRGNQTTRDIIDEAVAKWPKDYSMIMYEVKSQIEAYNKINSR